ncbi:DNA polymerase III subunit delta [Aureitalea marina]|uniref:DNA polymerase III subunit delta n=1 Tax=Aureitalea marina TaxID=930804 RepID=A0A2S7KTT9_9FLAO|nr:DNA polymerase III subunit delta [Aureitalea marina]PQB05943.1 DNA polymerase III subunit delta [Aureitalea marina]
MEEVQKIVQAVRSGNPAPIYLLHGPEPYYVDLISSIIEKELLSEEEKGFNQVVLYGRDVQINDLVAQAKRYPMMAPRQVIILKEAQDLARTIDQLAPYAENPQPTTVLVIAYKYKKLDSRKKLVKAIRDKGVVFESKKLYDNQLPEWIRQVLALKGYSIVPKAAQMLVEFLGNDLSKIDNELNKLMLLIPEGQSITPELVERNIGISKDFNNFELQAAIAERDEKKAFGIVHYFGQNPKSHPLLMTTAIMYGFFTKLMKYHALIDKSKASQALGMSNYNVRQYRTAASNYPMKKVSRVIGSIRTIDMKAKGVEYTGSHAELYKELLLQIMR